MTELQVQKLTDAGAWVDYRQGIWGESFDWQEKIPLTNFKGIVIHHTVTPQSGNGKTDADYVGEIHKARGFGGVGYHIIITSEYKDDYAVAYYVGDLGTARAHSPNSLGVDLIPQGSGNWYLLGISMVGSFINGVQPDQRQLNTFNAICEKLLFDDSRFPNLTDWNCVQPHKHYDATSCPGNWDYLRVQNFVSVTSQVEEPKKVEKIVNVENPLNETLVKENDLLKSQLSTLEEQKNSLQKANEEAQKTINDLNINLNKQSTTQTDMPVKEEIQINMPNEDVLTKKSNDYAVAFGYSASTGTLVAAISAIILFLNPSLTDISWAIIILLTPTVNVLLVLGKKQLQKYLA
jgi:hypothetical protein